MSSALEPRQAGTEKHHNKVLFIRMRSLPQRRAKMHVREHRNDHTFMYDHTFDHTFQTTWTIRHRAMPILPITLTLSAHMRTQPEASKTAENGRKWSKTSRHQRDLTHTAAEQFEQQLIRLSSIAQHTCGCSARPYHHLQLTQHDTTNAWL